VWVGIQEAVTPEDALVLFNSPFHKSTLAVPLKGISVDVIQDKIQASNKTFKKTPAVDPGYVAIPTHLADTIVTQLREIANTLERHTQEKK
jgi:hypothetical protein